MMIATKHGEQSCTSGNCMVEGENTNLSSDMLLLCETFWTLKFEMGSSGNKIFSEQEISTVYFTKGCPKNSFSCYF